jgi:hypothetical protein
MEARGQPFSVPRELFFEVEWTSRAGSRHDIVVGYVHNHYLYPITGVEVRVEIFDPAGRLAGEAFGWVTGDVPPGGRGYFEVALPRGGVTFGVTIYAFAFAPREAWTAHSGPDRPPRFPPAAPFETLRTSHVMSPDGTPSGGRDAVHAEIPSLSGGLHRPGRAAGRPGRR